MNELEALARAAPPGPWRGGKLGYVTLPSLDRVAECRRVGGVSAVEIAAYIAAANPTAILALLSELDTLSAKNKALAERVAGLEEGLSALLRCEYEAAGHGLTDCIDNDGNPYQSAHLEKQIKNAEALVAARTLITGADHAKG